LFGDAFFGNNPSDVCVPTYSEGYDVYFTQLTYDSIAGEYDVYPDPATTELWLQLPENMQFLKAQIELYSPTGKLLYKAKPESRFHKIETAHLPPGLYLVRMWDGKKWRTEKVVVE